MIDPTQQRQLLGRIVAGMEVCDVTGDKLGSIARVHHLDEATAPLSDGVPGEVLEVKTGFLGLGQRLYVPLSVVQEVFSHTIFLGRSREDLEALGCHEKPAQIG